MHDKILSTSPRSGETQQLMCDWIHSLTTKSGRQVAYISSSPSTNQNSCHTKVQRLPGTILISYMNVQRDNAEVVQL